jgi:hypothetical protein
MPIPSELRDLQARRHHEAHREAERETRADLIRTALACWAWCLLGVGLLAWSVHTTDPTLGGIAFVLGLGTGNAGMIFTLLAAYRRGEQRGDW